MEKQIHNDSAALTGFRSVRINSKGGFSAECCRHHTSWDASAYSLCGFSWWVWAESSAEIQQSQDICFIKVSISYKINLSS